MRFKQESSLIEDVFFGMAGSAIGVFGAGLWCLPLVGILTPIQVLFLSMSAGCAVAAWLMLEGCH